MVHFGVTGRLLAWAGSAWALCRTRRRSRCRGVSDGDDSITVFRADGAIQSAPSLCSEETPGVLTSKDPVALMPLSCTEEERNYTPLSIC